MFVRPRVENLLQERFQLKSCNGAAWQPKNDNSRGRGHSSSLCRTQVDHVFIRMSEVFLNLIHQSQHQKFIQMHTNSSMEGVNLPLSPSPSKDGTCSFQQGFIHQRLQLLFQRRLGTLAGARLLKHRWSTSAAADGLLEATYHSNFWKKSWKILSHDLKSSKTI